jgi:glutamate racemase
MNGLQAGAHITLGVLDWGIGGLGVVAALRRQGVRVPILYLSDTGATPYGKLPQRALAQRVDRVIEALRRRGATHVLIACNAASTVIAELATQLPVFGTIEPTLARLSARRPTRIGVIGGIRTVRSGHYRRGLLAAGHDVTQRVAQPLSAHIESGRMGSATAARDLTRILRPLEHVELLVLACTHYPAIAPRIEALLPEVELFDPADAVARTLARALPAHAQSASMQSVTELLCTADARAMRTAATRAWGSDPGRCRAIALG